MADYSAEIKSLLEEGAKTYAVKKYDVAVEHYGEACQLYSEEHDGEEDPELLFLYGQALFHVAVSRNGLFGGNPEDATTAATASQPKEEEQEEEKPSNNGMFTFSEDVPLAEEEDDSDEDEDDKKEEDENEDGDDEQAEGAGADDEQKGDEQEEGAQEEEQSDFEIAWEILDLARTLFESKSSDTKHDIPENVLESTDPIIKNKIKLSEIYDLLGEISLETENFKQASDDFESLLKIRETIYPFESNLISEAHYKLSLALEFNFENEDSKSKAIFHLKKAIDSIKKKQAKSETNKDVDLIKDLEIRLHDLQKDPNEAFNQQKQEILKGILGEATASDSKQAKPTSTTAPAVNDLTSIVKKRKAKPSTTDAKKAKN